VERQQPDSYIHDNNQARSGMAQPTEPHIREKAESAAASSLSDEPNDIDPKLLILWERSGLLVHQERE
jgi:hypothetical protein